ncbi:AI-2E family transporter [Coralliovum pocilloporae]|uniref:AI-2E family transporter n=1 Tax=Coralliovum pocilloporae TaxID=3066369 RepID=UPI0033077CB0
MTLKSKIGFWLAGFVAFILFLYVFRAILLPFVAGMALAYFLDPVADRLERAGMNRTWATVTILVLFLIVFGLALMLIIPLLGHQLAGFLANLPTWISDLQVLLASQSEGMLLSKLGIPITELKNNLADIIKEGAGWLATLAQSILNGGQALLNIAALFAVTPVVAFYLLHDWDRMVEKVDSWLPRDNVATVRQLASEIDASVSSFVRGQVSVCILLGIFYALGLILIGLKFGLLIGLGAGLISFIPYIGAILGLVVSGGVAIVQFWPDFTLIGLTLAVFAAGQFLEGNILQPKLVGKSVGLHPVWLMFALFAFGSLFGFVGMLIAVPAAAAIGVFVRFALRQYLESPLYHGHSPRVVETGTAETDET